MKDTSGQLIIKRLDFLFLPTDYQNQPGLQNDE